MKTFSAFLIVALTVLAFSPVAEAQDKATAINIAVININAIRNNALAVKSISDQVNTYRTAFQNEIQKEEEALRDANQELSRQRTLLSAEAFAEKRREFEQRVTQVQQAVQQRKGHLDRVQAESMGKVQDALNKIVSEIASVRGYNLILRQDQTVLVNPSLDITAPVLAALNKDLASVVVADPSK